MVGGRLRSLRKQKGMTQKELAALLGVTDAAIGMWENEKRDPDYETLVRLAQIFNTSVDYLLGHTDNRQPISPRNEPKSLEDFLREQEVMFDGVPLTDEDKESILQALKLLWRRRNRTNEQK